MIFLIFGDSITQGYWDAKGGWADRLKIHFLNADLKSNLFEYHAVVNLGIDGNVTRQVLTRFENETLARYFPDEKLVFIFAIGVNDTNHIGTSKFESTPEKYQVELKELISKARKFSNSLIFLDLTPVDENLTNPFPGSSTGKCYTNERIDKFNKILHKVCKENNFPCLEINKLFKQNNYQKLLIDGLHPNTNGHELIYKTVLGEVNKY